MSKKLSVDFAGLKLKSPLIVAAGPATRSVRRIQELAKAGVGTVVTKSTFLEEEYKEVAKPYAPHRFPDVRPKYVKVARNTYVWIAGFHEVPAEIWAESIAELKRTVDIPIIASEIATTINGYRRMGEMFENAGADALEFDMLCPMPYMETTEVGGLRASYLHPDSIRDAVIATKERVNIPVGIKIAFNPVQPEPLLDAIKTSGVDFINIAFSPAAMSGINLDTGKPYLPAPSGSISGPVRRFINYKYVVLAARSLGMDKPSIAATGCVMNWRDCVEYMMYGCTTVQLNHAILAHGPRVITRINNDLEKYLNEKGYSSVTELRGKALPYLLPSTGKFLELYGQTKGIIRSQVIPGRCNQCGICEETCPQYAITVSDEEPVIDKDLCSGCGLCVANCPTDALELINVESLYNLV